MSHATASTKRYAAVTLNVDRFPQCGHVCLPNRERAYRDHVSGKFWLQWGQVMWNAA
jgi:hypothetical protein